MKKIIRSCFALLLITVLNISYADPIRFGVIGDFGNNSSAEKRVSDHLKSKKPDFIITMGDNNYFFGCWDTIDVNIGKYYADYIGHYKGKYGSGSETDRFYPSIGNHDWAAKSRCLHNGTLPYLTYFTLPNNGLYYDYVKGPIHFFVLDSDPNEPDGNKVGSTQYQWLKQRVAESKACYKLVYFHHAPYSSGWHGDNHDMQWDYKQMGIDVVMSGHDHDYERIMRNNMLYFVNGVGGEMLSVKWKKTKGSQFWYNKHHGFMMVSEKNDGLLFEFFNSRNKLVDHYLLQKTC